jgi:hypothetical protein
MAGTQAAQQLYMQSFSQPAAPYQPYNSPGMVGSPLPYAPGQGPYGFGQQPPQSAYASPQPADATESAATGLLTGGTVPRM